MIVGVIISMYMVMMLVMLYVKLWIPKRCIKKSTNKTNKAIYILIRRYSTVHSIMSGNKQAGIQMHLHQNKQVKHWVGEINLPLHQKND